MNSRSMHALSTVCLALLLCTVAALAYYCAAQFTELPGSASLRARWNAETSFRGTKGHRSHNPAATGPVECGRLAMVAAGLGLGFVTLRRRAKMATMVVTGTQQTQ